MWSIENNTPFATGQKLTQDDRTGDLVWMVAAKATFHLSQKSHRPEMAEEQEELHADDEFREDPATSSLLHACDFALNRQKVDLLLEATAFTPGKKPVTRQITGVAVGSWYKALMVYGDRYYESFLGILYRTKPTTFRKKEIRYERAFGGWEEPVKKNRPLSCENRNPAGTGYFKYRSSAPDHPLPNVEYADFPTRRNSKKNRIAGYGPIAKHWSPRINHAGTYDQKAGHDSSAVRPPGFNPLYYQVAPEDQQLGTVKGGEEIRLYHLHPEYSFIRNRLPTVEIDIEALIGNKAVKKTGRLQSIKITPDQLKLQMVWQANFSNGQKKLAIDKASVTHRLIQL